MSSAGIVRFYDSFDGWWDVTEPAPFDACEEYARHLNLSLKKTGREYYQTFQADTKMAFEAPGAYGGNLS